MQIARLLGSTSPHRRTSSNRNTPPKVRTPKTKRSVVKSRNASSGLDVSLPKLSLLALIKPALRTNGSIGLRSSKYASSLPPKQNMVFTVAARKFSLHRSVQLAPWFFYVSLRSVFCSSESWLTSLALAVKSVINNSRSVSFSFSYAWIRTSPQKWSHQKTTYTLRPRCLLM